MTQLQDDASMPIAVIGMACRFPGDATSPEKLWELLANGGNAWSEFPKDRINIDGFYHPSGNRQGSICFKGGHFLKEDVAAWDAPFFSTTAHEAAAMDPQQRILLEVSYEAFENAGIPVETLPGTSTAVYCGSFVKDYEQICLRDPDDSPQYAATGNGIAIMSNRISWFYDLRGPSMTLDTGCSASLVGVHLACQSLRTGESSLAMAMGAGLILTPSTMLPMTALNFLSPDGKCFAFDERANGYGRGEGIGAVILKPLDAALRDNDTIRAVIRGSGVNQDGRTPGITMPSKEAQAINIRAVYKAAGLGYDRTAYFEAHGTGTQAGDPTELGAISKTFAEMRDLDEPIFVGSVKTNIGHLEGCAGIAGLVKGVLMLEKGLIPQNLYFEHVNPRIDLDAWKIKVPKMLTPWPMEGLRRVSINCFGFGGTNAHIILDDAFHYLNERGIAGNHYSANLSPPSSPSLADSGIAIGCPSSKIETAWNSVSSGAKIYVLSSHEESGIGRLSTAYSEYLSKMFSSREDHWEFANLGNNLAYTLASRRSKLPWKSFVVSPSAVLLPQKLSDSLSKPNRSSQAPKITFVFSGQGAQWFAMGRELLQYKQYSDSLNEADSYLKSIGSEWSLMNEYMKSEEDSLVNLPRISQPLCTAVQIALVDLLNFVGVSSQAVVGHSSGEIAAAYCLGAISKEDAWKLAYHRGRLTSAIKFLAPTLKGRMIAVSLSENLANTYIGRLKQGAAVVACINSPENVTVSGDECAITELSKLLEEEKIFARILKVENAYHSPHMKVIEHHYLRAIREIDKVESQPGKSMFSSLTGEKVMWQNLGASYWAQNLVSPVRFSDAVSSLLRSKLDKPDVLLEIGPHAVLQAPLKQILDLKSKKDSRPAYFSMLYREKDAVATSLDAVGQMWIRGCTVDLEKVNKSSLDQSLQVLTDLPTYPWNHTKTYWHESHLGKAHRFRKYGRQDLIGAPTADSIPFEPRWRGFLRVSENPWLQDHQVQNTIVYPAAGMVSMVLEAAQQTQGEGRTVEGYEISKMHIQKAMIIPTSAHGLETALNLKYLLGHSLDYESRSCFEFSIYSKLLDASWQQHCTGRLIIHYDSHVEGSRSTDASPSTAKVYQEEYSHLKETCSETVSPRQLYETLESVGMKYGPTFQNITSVQKANSSSCTTVRIPNTKSRMPAKYEYPHLIHPATLDAMFQTVFVAGNDPMVPCFLESIYLSVDLPKGAGYEFQGYSKASREGLRNAVGSIVMFKSEDGLLGAPKLIVKNLHFTALSTTPEGFLENGFLPNHHKLCAELVWKEEVDTFSVSTISKWLDLAAFKNPELHILETRGGNGSLTTSLLKVISSGKDSMPRLKRHTFTDSTSARFKQVKADLTEWAGYIDFKVLDLQDDLSKQGYKDHSFDIIIAHTIDRDQLTNFGSLLKSSGTLVLIDEGSIAEGPTTGDGREVSTSGKVEGIFENVTPFQLETIFPADAAFPAVERFVILSSCHIIPAVLSSREIVILLPESPSIQLINLSGRIEQALLLMGEKVTCAIPLDSRMSFSGKLCLALLEVDSPIICNWNKDEFAAFKEMISNARGCLWASRGGQMSGEVPFASLVSSLFRTIRSEDPQKSLYTLDLDSQMDIDSDSNGQAIIRILLKSFESTAASLEMEYSLRDGKLFIPRIQLEESLSSLIEQGDGQVSPKMLPFFHPGRPLQLEIGTPGRLDTLRFNDDPEALQPMRHKDVEIQVEATGVNAEDVRTAMGRTTNAIIGSDVAGVVKRVGLEVKGFKQGDRVCTIAGGTFKNFVHNQDLLVQLIPNDMSFEVAASLPTAGVTAYCAIVKIGNLQRGESILIHDAAGSLGQSAIQIAQSLGAEIFATVKNSDEVEIITKHYGVDKLHIFNLNSNFAQDINMLTEGKGINLTLNGAGRANIGETWSCVSEFGRFIEIGSEAQSLAVDLPRPRNVIYSTLDIRSLLSSNPRVLSLLLHSTFDLIAAKNLSAPSPLKVFNFGEISTVFTDMEADDNVGSVVFKTNDCDKVPVVPRAPSLQLDQNATYALVGGLGGLGRSIAEYLLKYGAKNIAFFSRSGAVSADQQTFLRRIQQQGAQVRTYICDICNMAQLKESIGKCMKEMPKIRGVIQGAAVDSIFDNMTYEDWISATGPKVQGSWNLHEAMPKDLDFFVFLSSSAGVIGARGQANYAVGNGFQDALASHRRSMGLAAVSLDLGPVLGAGMVAEDEATLDILRASGFFGVREKDFHLLISAAITGYSLEGCQTPPQVIVGTGTGGLVKQNQVSDPYWYREARFLIMRKIDLVPETTDSSSESMQNHLLAATSVLEAAAVIIEGLTILLAKSMNMLPDDLDVRKPANTYGVDSLVAVGTRNWIFRETGVDVSVFEILSETPISKLAENIATKCKLVSQDIRDEGPEP